MASSVLRAAGKRILEAAESRPSLASSVCLTPPRRSRLRAPPRVLGWTKTQILDFFMRTNAGICACISFSAIPFMVWWGYRYQTVLKPRKQALEQAKVEELLAEGKAAS